MLPRNASPLLREGAPFQLAAGATCEQASADVYSWLDSALGIVENVAMQLHDDGSHMQANPRDGASMLYGARVLIEMAKNAIVAAACPEAGSRQGEQKR